MRESLHEYCVRTERQELLSQWNRVRNGAVTPRDLSFGSSRKVWWQCSEGHIWKAVIHSRTGPRKHGCPDCAANGRRRRREKRQFDAAAREEF